MILKIVFNPFTGKFDMVQDISTFIKQSDYSNNFLLMGG